MPTAVSLNPERVVFVTPCLPEDPLFLLQRKDFHRDIAKMVDMGERKIDLLLTFLLQSHGTLPKRAIENEFALLTLSEVQAIQTIYADVFTKDR